MAMKHMFAIFRNRDFNMNPLKDINLDEIINCLTINIVFMPNCHRIIEYQQD